MRLLTLSTLFLVPAAVIAQAPAAGISDRLKAEQPVIDQLVKSFKAKEALAKAEALVAGEKPAYDTKDLNTVAASQNAWRSLIIAEMLASRTAFAAGEWEKGQAFLEKAAAVAKENKAAFIAGAQPTLDTWKAPEAEAQKFLAEMPANVEKLNADIAKAQAEAANVDAIKKMNKNDKAAFDQRQANARTEMEELKNLEAAKVTYENNVKNAATIRKFVDATVKSCDEDIALTNSAVEKSQARLKTEADAIKAFNDAQAQKKVKIKGKQNWVNAVMNDPTNVTRNTTAESQVSFLNRQLVLDPGNVKAQKALDNIIAGKDPFAVEKGKGKGKGKKAH